MANQTLEMANKTASQQEWSDRLNTIAFFSTFSAIGIITNSLPLLLTFGTKLKKNKVNILVANMSSADLLECVVSTCGQNIYILYRETLPQVGCKFLGFLQFVMAMQIFLFPPFLSLNRYISLFHSHWYDRLFSPRHMYVMIVASWLLSTIVPAIFLLGGQAKFDEDNEHCCIVTKGNVTWSVIYWLCIIIVLVGLCDGSVMFCNIKIFQRLCDHGTIHKLEANVVRQNREMLAFMIVDMVCPIVTNTVYHVSKFAYPNRKILFFRRFFSCLVLLNSALRGVVTLGLLGPYRRELKRIVSSITCGMFQGKTKIRPYVGKSGVVSVIGGGSVVNEGKVKCGKCGPRVIYLPDVK